MDFTIGDYECTLKKDGTVTIIRYNGIANELIIPSVLDGYSVDEIGEYAFSECRGLIAVTIPKSVERMGVNPFMGCRELKTIKTEADSSHFQVVDGVLFDKDKKQLICYPMSSSAESYDIPCGTRIIGDGAFFQCAGLTTITLPVGIERIGEAAFLECTGLIEIIIPDSVTTIGEGAFEGCDSLSDVILPGSLNKISRFAFHCCGGIEKVTISEGVTEIDHFAFAYCDKLAEVVLPASLSCIADDAFEESYRCIPKVIQGSYAQQYITENGFFKIE